MEWYGWVAFYLMLGVLVSAGACALGAGNYMIAVLAWPAFAYYLVMMAIAEKRGPNDPR